MSEKSRFAQYEASAQEAIDRNQAAAIQEQASADRQKRILDRAAVHNDRAELELFGSRGRTFTDPETGDVIADANNPTIGKIDSIKRDQKYGKTEGERLAYAESYENELHGLLDDGVELAQAKLLLDLDEADSAKRGKLIGDHISGGMTVDDAVAKVDALLDRAGAKRRTMILEGGAYTTDDYQALRVGEDLYPELLEDDEIAELGSESEEKIEEAEDEPTDSSEEAAPELDEAEDDEPTPLESKKTDANQYDQNDMEELRKTLAEEDAYEAKHRGEASDDSPIYDELKEETDGSALEGESLQEYEARQPGRHSAELLGSDELDDIANDTESDTGVLGSDELDGIANSDDTPATRRSRLRGAAAKFNPNYIYHSATAYAATRGEREQGQDKQGGKVRRGLGKAAFAGGLLVGAGLTFAKFYAMSKGADVSTGSHGGNGSGLTDHFNGLTPQDTPSAPEVPADSWSFGDGSGGEQLLKTHGIDPTVWYDHEDAFLKSFPDLAYRMTDGHVGLRDQSTTTSASKLPQVAQAWWERQSR